MNGGINCNLTLNTSNLGSSYGEFTVGEYVSYLAGNNLLPVPDNAVALETESQAFAGAYGRARGTSGKSWISIFNIEADAGVVSTLNQFGGLAGAFGSLFVGRLFDFELFDFVVIVVGEGRRVEHEHYRRQQDKKFFQSLKPP